LSRVFHHTFHTIHQSDLASGTVQSPFRFNAMPLIGQHILSPLSLPKNASSRPNPGWDSTDGTLVVESGLRLYGAGLRGRSGLEVHEGGQSKIFEVHEISKQGLWMN